jgi:positive regulator of sigma E activity
MGSGGDRVLEAENLAGGLAGDTVKVFISSRSVVLGAFFLYIFPVLAMISAYLFVYWITGSKTWGTSLSIAALVGSFFGIKPLERFVLPVGHEPKVVEIISRTGMDAEQQSP